MRVSASIETTTLENGMVLALEHMPGLQSVSFALLIERGSAWDPVGKCGLTAVLEEMILRGAGEMDARALTEAMDSIGFDRSVDSSSEVFYITGSLLGRNLETALEFTRDIILRPRLAEEDLAPSIDLAIHSVEAIEDSPQEKLFVELGERYLPWPHGRPSKGVIDEIRTITIPDLRSAVEGLSPKNAVLAIAGDIDSHRLPERVQSIFASFKAPPREFVPPPEPVRKSSNHVEKSTGAQVQIGMAMPLIAMSDPDYHKALLMTTVLSGGMSGRLFVEVREKRGLVYSVRAVPSTMKNRGDMYVYGGTTPERAKETISVIRGELEKLHDGISEEELSRARVQLLSSVVMSQESSRSRSRTMANDFHKLGRIRNPDEIIASINSVDISSMNAFLARTRFEPMILTLGPKWS